MKKYIKNLIRLINYERDAEIDLMTHEISTMSGQRRKSLEEPSIKSRVKVWARNWACRLSSSEDQK